MSLLNMSRDWRTDSTLKCITSYKKKFAYVPKICSDGTRVWWSNYYTKYNTWVNYCIIPPTSMTLVGHTDRIEDIPEDTYLIRQLIGNI